MRDPHEQPECAAREPDHGAGGPGDDGDGPVGVGAVDGAGAIRPKGLPSRS